MLFDRQRARPSGLNSVTKTMQGSDSGIASPGKHQPRGATHADHLVINQVGRHANQSQVLAPLADDLMARGERDQMSESLHRQHRAIDYQLGHGLLQACDLSQTPAPSSVRYSHV